MKDFDRIAKRLKGEMAPEEAARFDRELSENEELSRAFYLQKQEEEMLDLAVEEDLLRQIKEIRSGAPGSEGADKKSRIVGLRTWRRILSVAAGLALLVASYFLFRPDQPVSDPQALAVDMYEKFPPNFSGTKSAEAETEAQQIDSNRTLLLSGQPESIQAAIAFFESQKEQLPEANYYLGHGYWATGEYEKALSRFDTFLANTPPGNRLVPFAEFYRSLALLAGGQNEPARRFLLEKKEGHLFQKQMEELLQDLK